MILKALRFITALPGILFLSIGARWLVTPATVAADLKMPMLDGLARSTQIGDMSAFFAGAGMMILLGVVRLERIWLYSASLLLGGAALFRTIAWLAHEAPFASEFIGAEVFVTLLVLITASQIPKQE